jgi:hypothetical protein
MTTVAVLALAAWLATVFVLACYAVHLGLNLRLQLELLKASKQPTTFIPVAQDPSWDDDEKKLNAMLSGLEENEIEHMPESMFRQGPII